jgi:hypothetical protein
VLTNAFGLRLSILAGALILAVTAAGAAEPAAASQQRGVPAKVGVITWNICGAIKRCKGAKRDAEKRAELVRSAAQDKDVAVIMIQEACISLHSRPLERELEAATGARWSVRHRTAKEIGEDRPVTCPKTGLQEAGAAVFMKELPGSRIVGWDMRFGSTHEDAVGRVHSQGAACLQDTANKLLACSSHFANEKADPSGALRRASARDFHQQALAKQNAGYRTIIGGDLNLEPDSRDVQVLYDGNFEADTDDQCPTSGPASCTLKVGRKIDYVFFSDRGWDLDGGDAIYENEDLSDHWMLKGKVKSV